MLRSSQVLEPSNLHIEVIMAIVNYVEGNATGLNGFFKRKGVERAQEYNCSLVKFSCDEKMLVTKLFEDCVVNLNDGPLGSSIELREAIFDVLVKKYFEVTMDEFMDEKEKIQKNYNQAHAVKNGDHLPPLSDFAICAKIIERKMIERNIPLTLSQGELPIKRYEKS